MIEPEAALCSLFFCTISGQSISNEISEAAVEHWHSLTDAPWDTSLDQTRAYGESFFQGVRQMASMQPLLRRWASEFDSAGLPLPNTDRLAFLQDFLRTLLHSPHNYHNFFYSNPTLASDHPMDWPIEHPIAIEFWTIYVCWGGHGSLGYQDQVLPLPPGTICILSPGCEATLRRDVNSNHWSFSWLNFRPQLGWFELLDWAFSINQPTLLYNDTGVTSEILLPGLKELASISYQPADTNEKLCLNLIENMLIRLRRVYESQPAKVTTNSLHHLPDPRVAKAAKFVLNHYHESFKLGDVAEFANLSAGRLNELFREHYQTSLMQWRDMIRLNKARELLRHTELNISSIACSVGWEDPLYFSRRFKSTYGISPRRFRITGGVI